MPTPAEILGLTGPDVPWKLQYGLPGKKGLLEVDPQDLPAFPGIDPWFTVENGWVRVRVPVDAGTSSGSTYPRWELRQMTPAGHEAAWDSRKANCWFEYEMKPTRLPTKKPQMCTFQLHGDKDDLYELIYQRNSAGGYEWTQRIDGSSGGQPKIPHDLGRSCVLAMGVTKGVVTIYRDGAPILSTSRMPQSSKTYAKLGNYLQSNLTKDEAGEYGEILARNVRSGIGVYFGPKLTPVPAPAAPVPAVPVSGKPACPHCGKPVTLSAG